MAFQVSARVDSRAVHEMLRMAAPTARKAAASAMNKAVAKARTQSVREIAREYHVSKQAIIRGRMRLWRADSNSLAVRLRFRLRSIPVILQTGVRAEKRGGVRTPEGRRPGAWIMGSKLGGMREHVFVRTTKKRLPIKSLRIYPKLFFCRHVLAKHVRAQSETVAKEIVRQIVHRMNGGIGPSQHEGTGS